MTNKVLWEEEIKVRFVETDGSGVLHHSYIPIYFEIARATFFKNFSESYAAIERRGIFAPVIAYTIEILGPAFYEDILIVKVKYYDYTGVRLTLSYELVRKETSKTIATGLVTNMFVDEERKPINIRNRYPSIYNKLIKTIKNIEESK